MLYVKKKNAFYHNYSEIHEDNKILNNDEGTFSVEIKLFLDYILYFVLILNFSKLKSILAPIDQE